MPVASVAEESEPLLAAAENACNAVELIVGGDTPTDSRFLSIKRTSSVSIGYQNRTSPASQDATLAFYNMPYNLPPCRPLKKAADNRNFNKEVRSQCNF